MANSRRIQLNNLLKTVLGSEYVYYQPPEDRVLQYPCIVYQRDRVSSQHADDHPYRVTTGYQITYIDHMPDSDVIDSLLRLPTCRHERHFKTSGLNHDVFMIYY